MLFFNFWTAQKLSLRGSKKCSFLFYLNSRHSPKLAYGVNIYRVENVRPVFLFFFSTFRGVRCGVCWFRTSEG